MTSAPVWTFADAWLLAAAGQFGRRGCSLSELLGAADALNHDVPIERAAAMALGRLIASDLLQFDGDRYRCTRRGRTVYRQRRRGMFEQSTSILEALGSVPCVDGVVEFGPGEYAAACERYYNTTKP